MDVTSLPSIVSFSQNLVQDELSQHMFALTEKMKKKLPVSHGRADGQTDIFPQLPGSHLPLSNPALEFVKTVCQVLGLDSNVSIQMKKLKRDLLKLIGVGEFSSQAVFDNPCLSFVLPEMICKSCNQIRDLDLCRDVNVEVTAEGTAKWACPQCQTDYDSGEIEQLLVDSLQRKSMAYVLQDLACRKCAGVKEANMPLHCSCAGEFRLTYDLTDFGKQLVTLQGIARHYKMELLSDMIDLIAQSNPGLEL
ncbi:DNA polymerase epsilon catalytic subunit A [Aplysia californica]|uniref:DNA polymerase epsilon catalytic subunit n=1 Tax=Aplysia californica TaxID=6500 RepID=A0ABM1A573_APLCA|nr:DNA polymerase epsilon catalytic subunit A [Aplysia californica]